MVRNICHLDYEFVLLLYTIGYFTCQSYFQTIKGDHKLSAIQRGHRPNAIKHHHTHARLLQTPAAYENQDKLLESGSSVSACPRGAEPHQG